MDIFLPHIMFCAEALDLPPPIFILGRSKASISIKQASYLSKH